MPGGRQCRAGTRGAHRIGGTNRMLRWQRLRRWSAMAAVLVLSTTGLLLAGGSDAGALGIPSFSLTPASAAGATPRTAFRYDALPGQTINDSVVLANSTS